MDSRINRRAFVTTGAALGAMTALRSGTPVHAAAPPADSVLNLKNLGAKGDGVANDGPPLEAALEALASAGGGRLDVPPGTYRISTPVSKNFLNRAAGIVIQGSGASSQFLFTLGTDQIGIDIVNVESCSFQDLTFIGTPGRVNDVGIALRVASCWQATLRRCDFYGLSSGAASGAVVQAINSDLRIESCGFRGCGASLNEGGVIRLDDWIGLAITNSDFIDWGYFKGVYLSKTPIAPPQAWVRVGNAQPTNFEGKILLDRVRMDEGALFGVAVLPNASVSPRVASVVLSGLRVNVAGFAGGRGCHISFVENLVVEHSWFGYTTNVRDAIYMREVVSALVDSCLCVAGANRIVANADVGALHVRESVYGKLISDARETVVTKAGVAASLIKAGTPVEPSSLVVWSPTEQRRVVTAPPGISGSAVAGVALDAAAAGEGTRVVMARGSFTQVRSDGAGAIPSGGAVGPSPSLPGRIRAISSGHQVGRAVASVGSSPNAYALVQLSPALVGPEALQEPALENGWQNFGGSRAVSGYYRDGETRVHLTGTLKGGTTTAGTVLFTLPMGYRPPADIIVPVATSGGTAQIEIRANGAVTCLSGVTADYLSIENTSFRAKT